MTPFKKVLLTSLAILALNPQSSFAESSEPVTFKSVMQGLLTDTKKITEGIVLEDFALIESSANKIVSHPKPDLIVRMKLIKAIGSEMGKFKAKDTIVHDSAVNLVKAAQAKDMAAVKQEYSTLINGCLGCHSNFKEKVAKILK